MDLQSRKRFCSSFNPRAREGRDRHELRCLDSLEVSIHAPARGATSTLADMSPRLSDVSIHAPARGATMARSVSRDDDDVSIHAPARGATTSAGA